MPHVSLAARLREGPPLVGDGAWGTMLMQRGLAAGEPPEAMALRSPEVVEGLAREYLEAGADLLTADTFGASPLRLRAANVDLPFRELNRRAVEIARGAVGGCGRAAWVLGSVGPCGGLLAPLGEVSRREAEGSFRDQVLVLAESGADAILVETMTDAAEAELAIAAALAEAPALPVLVTFSFDPTPRGFFTVMGTALLEAVHRALEAGADVVGANCGHGMETYLPLARALREATSAPLAVQPNAGLPRRRDGRDEYPDTPDDFARGGEELAALGVRLLGGCCGTTTAHVRALRRAVSTAPMGVGAASAR